MLTSEELAAGGPIYTHAIGQLSIDPFLTMRFITELDPDADRECMNPGPRTK